MTRQSVPTKGAESAQKALFCWQGNGRDLILVFLKTWRLTLKLCNDHTWAVAAGRELHGDQRALQLLLHLGDAPEDPGEAAGEEGRQELRAAGKQEARLLPGRFQHAGGACMQLTPLIFVIFDRKTALWEKLWTSLGDYYFSVLAKSLDSQSGVTNSHYLLCL